MERLIERSIRASIETKIKLLNDKRTVILIERAAKLIARSIKNGGKLIVFGNGGSAADSQHIAAELVGRFKKERRALGAIALTTDTSSLTALANDYGYESVFKRQVEALAKRGDAALGISTSGNSVNVLEALKLAKKMGLKTISLSGCGGGKLKKTSDISIVIDSGDTARIQESHIMIGHILCQIIEDEFSK
ncbi:MAG: D-sedoheptulose 7-phosphate isomerase [Candidatus Omnitrophota bacterium]|jgi:D-sedoheptulose 7-phosphate isomerase